MRHEINDSSDRPGWFRRVARLVRRLGPAGPMAVAALVLPLVGITVLVGFLSRIGDRLHNASWGPPVCAAAFAVAGGFALLPTVVLSLFAGWAFGFKVGFPTALAGFAGASVVGYALARRVSGRRVVDVIGEHPKWRAVHRALLEGGEAKALLIILLLRLPTAPPFAATTVILAAMRVRWRPYLLGTILGIAPRTAVYVYAAARAGKLDLHADEAGDTKFWLLGLTVAALLAVVALVTILARQALAKLTDAESPGPNPPA